MCLTSKGKIFVIFECKRSYGLRTVFANSLGSIVRVLLLDKRREVGQLGHCRLDHEQRFCVRLNGALPHVRRSNAVNLVHARRELEGNAVAV